MKPKVSSTQRKVLEALVAEGAYIDAYPGVWLVPPGLYPWERMNPATFRMLLREEFIVDFGWTRYRITDAGREMLQTPVALQANDGG